MKRKPVLTISIAVVIFNFCAIVSAQSKSEIISYFENKTTPTVYFAQKALKRNEVLKSEIVKTDTTKVAFHKTNVGPGNKTVFVPGFKEQPMAKIIDGSKPDIKESLKAFGVQLDIDAGNSIYYDFKSKIRTGEVKDYKRTPEELSFLSFDITNKNTSDFVINNCSEEIDSGNIYVETGIDICKLEFPSSNFSLPGGTVLENLDSNLINEIEKIDTSKVNNFYFFDSFITNGSNVAHGNLVYSIIKNELTYFHALSLLPKVKKVPLDFFDENVRQDALVLIKEYYNNKYKNSEIIEPIKLKLKYYDNIEQGTCSGLCMPSDYLNILLDYYLIKKPEIISMSFYMKTLFPVMCFPIQPTMYTNLLGAVQNNTGEIELVDTSLSGRASEPQFTLRANIAKTGTMLVGAESKKGQYPCLYSADGTNVSIIGHGEWNGSYDGAPTLYGTSWATPEIAAKLFIAKAFWKSARIHLNAQEAKKRLLLSSDIDTNYVGMFASAGIPNINKLLRKNPDGFIEKGDTVLDISFLSNPKILIHQKNEEETLFNLKNGLKINYAQGFYYLNGSVFVFQESIMKWEKIQNLKDIEFKDFEIRINNSGKRIKILSLQDFSKNHINQIVRL